MLDGTLERPDMRSHAGAWEREHPNSEYPAKPGRYGVSFGRSKSAIAEKSRLRRV